MTVQCPRCLSSGFQLFPRMGCGFCRGRSVSKWGQIIAGTIYWHVRIEE